MLGDLVIQLNEKMAERKRFSCDWAIVPSSHWVHERSTPLSHRSPPQPPSGREQTNGGRVARKAEENAPEASPRDTRFLRF